MPSVLPLRDKSGNSFIRYNMSALANFIEWLYNLVKKGVLFVASVPGMIVAAVSSTSAFIASAFSNFTWWSYPVQWLQSASSSIASIVNNDFGPVGLYILRSAAVDRLVAVATVCVSATFGVVIAVFVILFVAVLALVPACLSVKALLKAVRVASAGFIDP